MTLKNYTNKRYPSDFVGPPIQRASVYILARIRMGCKVCEECGEPWHWDVQVKDGVTPQINICGHLLAIRRAVYILKYGKPPHKGTRATSPCPNKHCCDPEKVMARRIDLMVSDTYASGARNKAATVAMLQRHCQANNVKLQPADVLAVRADTRPPLEAAAAHGITPEYFRRIHSGRARMGIDLGPFAALVTSSKPTQERRA
jgi:hypothetical protein